MEDTRRAHTALQCNLPRLLESKRVYTFTKTSLTDGILVEWVIWLFYVHLSYIPGATIDRNDPDPPTKSILHTYFSKTLSSHMSNVWSNPCFISVAVPLVIMCCSFFCKSWYFLFDYKIVCFFFLFCKPISGLLPEVWPIHISYLSTFSHGCSEGHWKIAMEMATIKTLNSQAQIMFNISPHLSQKATL